MTVFEQGAFQHGIVLDDAVMDQHQASVATGMRVGVGVVGFAVGRPTGMAHADIAAGILVLDKIDQLGDFPFFLVNIQRAILQGNSGAVIPAVFESLQPVNQNGIGFF